MREMGTVELLTREDEIDIAKRIEEGVTQVQSSVAECPEAIADLLKQYDNVELGEMRLSELLLGFIDSEEAAGEAALLSEKGRSLVAEAELSDLEEDEEGVTVEEDNSVDPKVAWQKFAKLREQYHQIIQAIQSYGREHGETVNATQKLSFKLFRLVPRQFDRLVTNMRQMMDRVRAQEWGIIRICG